MVHGPNASSDQGFNSTTIDLLWPVLETLYPSSCVRDTTQEPAQSSSLLGRRDHGTSLIELSGAVADLRWAELLIAPLAR